MSNETELKQLVLQYKEVKELRLKLDKASRELKEGKESELQDRILQHMLESGVQSIHYPEIGRVIRTTKSHYEIVDKEKFAREALYSMLEADRDGRPVAEAMLAQFRVSKEAFESFIEHSGGGTKIEDCGVSMVDKPELSIRKS